MKLHKIITLIKRHKVFVVVSLGIGVYALVAHIFKALDIAPMVETSYLLTEITKEAKEI